MAPSLHPSSFLAISCLLLALLAALVGARPPTNASLTRSLPRRLGAVPDNFGQLLSAEAYCPFPHISGSRGPAVGEDAILAGLIDELAKPQLGCIERCVQGVHGYENLDGAAIESALRPCAECVAKRAELQRQAVTLAMDEEHNTGCKLPAAPADGCYLSAASIYNGYGMKEGRRAKFVFDEGWWSIPEEFRRREEKRSVEAGACRSCIPADGIGSVFSFIFNLFAVSLESGCTFVDAKPSRFAHGVKALAAQGFFRAAAGCIGERHEWLEKVPTIAKPADDEGVTEGSLLFASRGRIMGSPSLHAFRMGVLRGIMAVCGSGHSSLLARLLLRAKFETGQVRATQLRHGLAVPTFIAQSAARPATTQLAQSEWFSPLGPGPRGALAINVVMHVRRGDVHAEAASNHGIYAVHFAPISVISAAFEVLTAAWKPLAAKLGLYFRVYVASEGNAAEFPVEAWNTVLESYGEVHLRLRPFADGRGQGKLERAATAANLTALQTMGQMFDADVLLADGRSLFSLAGNAWATNSLFLTYPWLLHFGGPLNAVIKAKGGDIDAAMPAGEELPLHPAYQALEATGSAGLHHPGVGLLQHAHHAKDFREELELLYRYRQTAVLQGMLADVVQKKKHAIERGAHFNWLGY